MTALPISGVIGAPLSAWLMNSAPHFLPLAGWQWMFLCEGLPAVVCGLIFWRLVPDRIDDAKWLSGEEKAAVKAELGDADHHHSGSFSAGLVDGGVWLLCLIYFCFVAALYGVSFWLPTLIKALGYTSLSQIGWMTAIPYGAAVVAMLALAWSSDRNHERRWHLAFAGTVGGVLLVASVLLRANPMWSFIALTVAMAGIVSTIPLFWNLPTTFLTGATAATGFALITSIGNLSGFAAPYLMGLVADATGQVSSGLFGLAGAAFAGVALIWLLPTRVLAQGRR